MYKPFLSTAILSILYPLLVFTGRAYFPEFTSNWLYSIIGLCYFFCALLVIGLSIRDFKKSIPEKPSW